MDPTWEVRKRWFLGNCRPDKREVAEAAVDRLLEFTRGMSWAVVLDDRTLKDPFIAFKLTNRGGNHLWKAYAHQSKVEFLTRWARRLSPAEQQEFLNLWENVAGCRLPVAGKGNVPTLTFEDVTGNELWPNIEKVLDWACKLPPR